MTPRKGGLPALILMAVFFGSDLEQVSSQLAARISDINPRPRTIRLEVRDAPSPDVSDLVRTRALLEKEFRQRGIELADRPEALTVTLSLSESLNSRLLIAEIEGPEFSDVFIFPLAKVPMASPRLRLQESLLYRQNAPALDFDLQNDRLWVLSPGKVSRFKNGEQGWKEDATWSLDGAGPLPRDPRGRILVTDSEFRVFLPGFECRAGTQAGSSVECRADGNGFPTDPSDPSLGSIRLKAGRNYFDQAGRPGAPAPGLAPFSAAAVLSSPEGHVWAVTDLLGTTRLYNSAFDAIGRLADRSSDLVAVQTLGCGGWFLVLTGTEGQQELRPFQWNGKRVVASSERLRFEGIVTALWPDREGRARVVVRDLKSDTYALWSVALACAD